VGARCANRARRDLCGGCAVMRIPTAIALLRKPIASGEAIAIGFCNDDCRTFALYSKTCANVRLRKPTSRNRSAQNAVFEEHMMRYGSCSLVLAFVVGRSRGT
jgi:hypothetical protein